MDLEKSVNISYMDCITNSDVLTRVGEQNKLIILELKSITSETCERKGLSLYVIETLINGKWCTRSRIGMCNDLCVWNRYASFDVKTKNRGEMERMDNRTKTYLVAEC